MVKLKDLSHVGIKEELLQPEEKEAIKEEPEFCLASTRGWVMDWAFHEVYFARGEAALNLHTKHPQGARKMDSILATGGIDYDREVMLFQNCQNGFWSLIFKGPPSDLSRIFLAAFGDREIWARADGKA